MQTLYIRNYALYARFRYTVRLFALMADFYSHFVFSPPFNSAVFFTSTEQKKQAHSIFESLNDETILETIT